MDLESIYRLGLSNISSIDLASSDERYDQSTNNHIIELYFIIVNYASYSLTISS